MALVRPLLCRSACAFTHFEHVRWESAVPAYDDLFGRLTAQAARSVAEHVSTAAGGEGPGLDLATGPAYVVEEMLKRGTLAEEIVAVDFSAAMLRRARQRLPAAGLTWLEADIQEPLPERFRGHFAWCSCNFGVLHLARPEAFFTQARAALRPGGVLAFTTWAAQEDSPAFQIPLTAISTHGSADVGLPPGPPFFKYSDVTIARRELSEAGFDRASVRAEVIEMQWELDRPEQLWTAFLEGTARTGGMLDRQAPEAKLRIESAMHTAVCEAQPAGGPSAPPYVLRQPCLLYTARVPE